MPSVNERLADHAVVHAVQLLRVGNGIERDILSLLTAVEDDIARRIGATIATMPQPPGYPYDTATNARLARLLGEIRSINATVYSKGYEELATTLGDLAEVEADHQAAATLNATLPVDYRATLPQPALLRSIATARPFDGFLLKDHFAAMAKGAGDRVERQIRIGMIEGQGVEKIVRRVRGVEVYDVSRRSARSVVRTAINTTANQASQETWSENRDIIKGWQFVATLDSRTSLICAANDGKMFPVGEGPVPSLHRGCRSTSVAITKSYAELGYNDREDYAPEFRASMDGRLAAGSTFQSWLKAKPEAFQREFLGPARFELYRSGKLDLGDFVRDGREVLTLEQLKAAKPKSTKPPVKATAKAEPKRFAPRDPTITDATIKVRQVKEIKAELNAQAAEAARDSRYIAFSNTRGIKVVDYGKASIPTSLTPEAASLIGAIKPEVDAICDKMGVPRLRGIKGTTRRGAVMSHGEGVLNVNADYVNGYAANIGKGVSEVGRKIDALSAEISPLRKRINEAYNSAVASGDLSGFYEANRADMKRLRLLEGRVAKEGLRVRRAGSVADQERSNWKPGDDPKDRPFTIEQHFDSSADKMRSLMYHEIAHLTHDYYNNAGGYYKVVQGTTRLQRSFPPQRAKIEALYRGLSGKDKDRLASTYASSNGVEWFAESFALYMMGRVDLVNKTMIGLIEEMIANVAK